MLTLNNFNSGMNKVEGLGFGFGFGYGVNQRVWRWGIQGFGDEKKSKARIEEEINFFEDFTLLVVPKDDI